MYPQKAHLVKPLGTLVGSGEVESRFEHEQRNRKAYPRDFMGFDLQSAKHHEATTERIDAIYIPTRLTRLGENQSFHQCLKKYARNVFLITGDEDMGTKKESDLEFPREFELIGGSAISDNHNTLLNSKSGKNPSQKFMRNYDLPAKRNFALQHAKLHQLNEIMLLDDDIIIDNNSLRDAITLLRNEAPMVGFYVLDHPDVSTIDHLNRMITGIASNVSVAANCILLNQADVRGFFPYTYNEDWMFIYAANANLRKVAAGFARQLHYEPWLQNFRIEFEQFGDILAEGVKSNLSGGLKPLDGSIEFWSDTINKHLSSIHDLYRHPSITPEYASVIEKAMEAIRQVDAESLVNFTQRYSHELLNHNDKNDDDIHT